MKANIFALDTEDNQEVQPIKKQADNEFMVPEILNQDAAEKIAEFYHSNLPKFTANNFLLNFSQCRRIDTQGLTSLVALAKKMEITGRYIYIDNIDNNIFKVMKITGKQDYFRFPHRGQYLSERFIVGGPRC